MIANRFSLFIIPSNISYDIFIYQAVFPCIMKSFTFNSSIIFTTFLNICTMTVNSFFFIFAFLYFMREIHRGGKTE